MKAKNKITGEIVEYSKGHHHNEGLYLVTDQNFVVTEDEFNELYDRVEDTSVVDEVIDKWDKQALEACGLDNKDVEDTTPQWEIDLEKQFGHWDVPTTPIKMFIHDTLKAERRKIVEIVRKSMFKLSTECGDYENMIDGEELLKLIQK